jgi:cytochrome c-type biogenesis protein CcmF
MLMFIGFAGSAYQKEKTAKMAPGDTVSFEGYTVRFDKLAHEEDRQKEMVTGEVTASVDGQVIDHLRPARWFFHGHESEPTTEVAMRRSPAEDLYITLGNYDLAEGTGTLKLVVNPVVDWIWFGFMLLAIGTGIALVPDTVLERLTARAAASAATPRSPGMAGLALWLAVGLAAAAGVGLPRAAHAQEMATGPAPEAPSPVGPEENWLVHNIMCQCGTCRHTLIDCASENCGRSIEDRIAIRRLLDQKNTREQIIQYFINKYGSQVALASPLDQGFNRLAWLLPYSLGILGAGGLGFFAYRLARRASPVIPTGEGPPPISEKDQAEALSDKLDDELRNLD